MTRDDIIRMAREAGIVVTGEAVWKLCEELRHPWGLSAETEDWVGATDHCAAAIRARGN